VGSQVSIQCCYVRPMSHPLTATAYLTSCCGSLPVADDDIITIKCPDDHHGTSRCFMMKRSSMMRSPAFIEFFRSEHYLHGSKMLLTFVDDPAACFQVLKYYLDEGPDCYTKTRLRVHVTLHYKMIERFVVLGRIYLLAKKLSLGGLMNMAYDAIVDSERCMTAGSSFIMASLVYAREAGFDKPLKDWCLKHIENHFFALYEMEAWWTELADQLEPDLGRHWAQLVEANGCLKGTFEHKTDQAWLERIIHNLAQEGQPSIISVIEERSYAQDVQKILDEVWAEDRNASDEEWEEVDRAPGGSGSTETTGGAASIMSNDMIKRKRDQKTLSHLFDECAKARSVMGMDVIQEQMMSSTRTKLRGGRLLRFLRQYQRRLED
jgi:hypothetical protein